MQQTLDISWMELSRFLSVVKEIRSYPNGIPKEASPITETGLFRKITTSKNPEINSSCSSSSVSCNNH